MKIKKLLSLLMMINDEFRYGTPHEYEKQRVMDEVERLYSKILEFQDGIPSLEENTPKLPDGDVKVSLTAIDESGRGMSSLVKFYPLTASRPEEGFTKINGRIDMIVKHTDRVGHLTVMLPRYILTGYGEGKVEAEEVTAYMMELSRGTEYKMLRRVVVPGEGAGLNLGMLTLERIINLGKEGWFAGDLHHHSIYSSPVHGGTDDVRESPEEVRTSMTAMGLSFGALSDHHNIFNHRDWLATETEDFLPLVSKEISTGNGHVMALNVPSDVIYHVLPPAERTEENQYEEFIRITEEIKSSGGLAQVNHPMDIQPAISLSEHMKGHTEIFETMEIWNGSVPMMPGTTNYKSFRFWLELIGKGKYIPATTGSDTHNTRVDDYHGLMNELLWTRHHLGLLEEKNEEIDRFLNMIDTSVDALELWAEETLGTACVRTYVHLESGGAKDRGEILDALRGGRSFLTNGPVLIPCLEGKSCGETVKLGAFSGEIIMDCTIMGQKPFISLEIFGKKGVLAKKDLTELKPGVIHRVSLPVNGALLEQEDALICRLWSDHTHMAIANPVLVSRES